MRRQIIGIFDVWDLLHSDRLPARGREAAIEGDFDVSNRLGTDIVDSCRGQIPARIIANILGRHAGGRCRADEIATLELIDLHDVVWSTTRRQSEWASRVAGRLSRAVR